MDLILLGNVIYLLVMYGFGVKNVGELVLWYLLMMLAVFVAAIIIICVEEIGGTADIWRNRASVPGVYASRAYPGTTLIAILV